MTGWGNHDKQNTAPLNKAYYDTNTALFTFIHTLHAYVCLDPLSKASRLCSDSVCAYSRSITRTASFTATI